MSILYRLAPHPERILGGARKTKRRRKAIHNTISLIIIIFFKSLFPLTSL